MNNCHLISILILINNIWGTILLYRLGIPLIKLLNMDELTELNNKITLAQKEYSLETDTTKRQLISKRLIKLNLQREVLVLKEKIKNLSA